MVKVSNKARLMPASPIRKLAPYAERAKANGIEVIHLNIGQPDIKTPAIAIAAAKAFDNNILEYTHSAGNISYRSKLVSFYNNKGIEITTDDLMITTGGSEAILFAFMTCMDSGDQLLVPEPFYANYNGFASEAGIEIVPIHSTIDNDFALPPIELFEENVTPKTKAIMLCNPNNPTGYLYTKEEMLKIRDFIIKYDLFLICDEVYRDFCYSDQEYYSCMDLKGAEQNVILIDSVSKRYSMCGARIGVMASKNKDVIASALKFGQARLCAPIIEQIAAEAALETPKEYFDNVYSEYLSRRNFLVAELNKIEGVYCPMPKGAFYTVAKLPVDDAEKFSQWLLESFSYQNKTVMLAPASGFYATEGLGKDQVRIAYVLKIEDLRTAVNCLKEALLEYNNIKGN